MISLAKWSRLLVPALMALVLLNAPVRADDDDDAATAAAGGRVPLPAEIEAKGEQCVQPEAEMRRNHMNYILHQRDQTMHQGIRTKQYSLKECINCHVQPTADGSYPSIHTKEHFCNSCHTYAAVKIDCFECHATRPEGETGDAHATPESAKVDASGMRAIARARAAGGLAQ